MSTSELHTTNTNSFSVTKPLGMNTVLFFDACLALLFIGLGVFCSMLPLVTSSNKRGFTYYFCSGGLLAFTMNFFKELEPDGLDIPIKYASNVLAILGFLLILSLTTVFVFEGSQPEYAPVDVEDGSLNFEIDEIEMMLSDSKRSVPHSTTVSTGVTSTSGSNEINVLSDTCTEKVIISTSTVVVLSYLNFFIGFWFSCKEHTGYKDLIVAIFNHCLLATALSAVIVGLHWPQLPRSFWLFVVCLSSSAPVGILVGGVFSHSFDGSAEITNPFMHPHLKILIHLGLCVCRGALLYISTICMISHTIVNKNYDRTRNVVAVLCGSLLFSFMNEF